MKLNPETVLGEFKTSDGLNLSHRLVMPKSPHFGQRFPGVLLVHGSSSEHGRGAILFETLQERIASEGFASMAFDVRGVGNSEGSFEDSTLINRIQDTKEAYKRFVQTPFIDCKRMSLVGVSMGGHVVARLAGEHPEWFRSLVLINPAAYCREAEGKRLKPSSEFSNTIRRVDSWIGSPAFDSVRKFKGLVLTVRSQYDQVIPLGVVDSYIYSSNGHHEHITIPEVSHTFFSGTDPVSARGREYFYSELVDYLKRYL